MKNIPTLTMLASYRYSGSKNIQQSDHDIQCCDLLEYYPCDREKNSNLITTPAMISSFGMLLSKLKCHKFRMSQLLKTRESTKKGAETRW